MTSLKLIQLAITLITLFLAYILVISPVGWFRTWVAQRMGDTTGEDLGFLTLNPAAHVDFIGILVLFVFHVGWGRHIPINPLNIQGNRRGLKLAAAYFSDTFAHLVLATCALVIFIGLFGVSSLGFYATHVSSLGISIARILVVFIHLNVFLAAISLVINGVMLMSLYIAERNVQFPPYFFYFIILAPMLLLIFFGEDLRNILMCCIHCAGNFFARLCGL